VWTERTSPALAAPFTPADLPPEQRAAVFQAEAGVLKAENERLQRVNGVLQRQLADYRVAPGGVPVTTDPSAGTAGRDLPGWPSCDPGVVNGHPLLWPSTREAWARWNLWARDHPDRAKKSLAGTDRAELRAVRDDLRHALGEVEAALPHP
jgi:hypothetical protein